MGLRAIILVGGYGTRLRPLTLSVPKPLLDFANKPMLFHQLEALADAGVSLVVLAINFHPHQMAMDGKLEKFARERGIDLKYSVESEPLGTAGPIALAREFLETNEPFYVLNCDIMCEFPLRDMMAFHRKHGKAGTIMVTKVNEPLRYGVVVSNTEKRIISFVEKPTTYVGNTINAGIYIFNQTFFTYVQPSPSSIEHDVFPLMADEGELFSYDASGFWMDVGRPKAFLGGMSMYLAYLKSKNRRLLARGTSYVGNVLVDPTAVIGDGCVIGPDVVIGPNCKIDNGVRLSHTVLLAGVTVKSHSWVRSSIIGWQSVIGRWVRIEGHAVIGEDVQVKDEVYLNGARVLPHKALTRNVPEPVVVM